MLCGIWRSQKSSMEHGSGLWNVDEGEWGEEMMSEQLASSEGGHLYYYFLTKRLFNRTSILLVLVSFVRVAAASITITYAAVSVLSLSLSLECDRSPTKEL